MLHVRSNISWIALRRLSVIGGIALSLSSSAALAQSTSTAELSTARVSGLPGEELDLDVSFTAGADSISALRFELTLPAGATYVSTAAGAAATAAGKSTSASAIESGVRVLVFGLNADAIGNGVVARIKVALDAASPAGTMPVTTRVLDASSPSGQIVALAGIDGEITVEGVGPQCGDGTIDPGETCDPPGSCPSVCDDGDACTVDVLAGSAADCTASCSFSAITQCVDGDGCCAPGCNSTNDNDCPVSCGNGVLEAGETCDPSGSCPTACDDGNACTTDILSGSASACDAACAFEAITQCIDDDGCCAAGCNSTNDNDCSVSCGNGVLEAGETCDPPGSCPTACDDQDACTTDTLVGSVDQCSAECSFSAITQCIDDDGCCAPGCSSVNDNDCPESCGNGVLEAGETCDPPGSCPTTCDDQDACTVDTLVGSADQCNAECSFSAITQCVNGDGCCAPGCDSSTDDDCAPTETPTCDDQDGDGFGVSAEGCAHTEIDCDDAQQDVHPGAAEVCNNLDDNCDGQVDEGTNLKDDEANCGACGNVCASAEVCIEGQCTENALTLSPPDPGNAGSRSIIVVQGATPGGYVELAYGFKLGESTVRRCPEVNFGIRRTWVTTARADDNGIARFRIRVARWAAGLTIYLQAADRSTCSLTEVLEHTFTRDRNARDDRTSLSRLSASGGDPTGDDLEAFFEANGELDGERLLEVDAEPIDEVTGTSCSATHARGARSPADGGLALGLLGILVFWRLRRGAGSRSERGSMNFGR
ncbi:MAG: putative metal-binding motif-containing protein [Deltaproteobacteria bacterium]|nr:putative metal-binding motif-containing protein [Deltaproteobacteria bacterium]